MIHKIAVLGAGTMGHGIAYVAAVAGFETTLFDVTPQTLQKARSEIGLLAQQAVDIGKLGLQECESALARLSTTTNLADAVRNVGMVIEAVPEKIDVKLSTFEALQIHAPAEAIVTTNTSALSITEMAGALDDPGRVAGMHFFNPVHRMKLVEIVRALETRDDTLTAVEEVARRMGKETVLVREAPGFVTTRINALIGNEAFYMLQEGVASATDIDKAIRLGLNHPMGPFELVDIVGLDTRLNILQHLHRTLGGKFRPCPLLEQHVRAGRLGKKVGKGVYDYSS